MLKDAETPVGRPVAANATVPVNPPVGVMVMVLVPLAPCARDKLLGDAEGEKSGAAAALTLSAIVVV